MTDGRQRFNRLRWLCRRGMKELDVLLEAFLEREAEALMRGEFVQLERFLQAEDDELWAWLQGSVEPGSEWQRALRDDIRG